MKLSQYCFLLSNKRGYYIFSTLFFSIIQVDEDAFHKLQIISDEGCNVSKDSFGAEFFNVLCENGFLTNSFEEEFIEFKKQCINARLDERNLHLTIVPTMRCCFSCAYCFEKQKNSDIINSDTIDSVLAYIQRKAPDSLHVSWFGGEPLLAIKQIEEFSGKLNDSFSGNYSSDIVTTGFPVNEGVIESLKRSRISEIQITIDGAKENHNRVKFTKGCTDPFSRVFDNIELITSSIPEMQCVIRVNVTKDNIYDIPFLHSLFTNRFSERNVCLSPSLVMENGIGCSEQLFGSDDFRILSKGWWDGYRIPTKWIYGLDRTECAIRNPSALVVMPDGSVCRCWEVVGAKEYYIGKLTKGGFILYNNDTFADSLNLCDPFLNETCSKCPYLPICYGGCPIKSLKQSQQDFKQKLACTAYKDHLEEWLEIYLEYRELMNLS